MVELGMEPSRFWNLEYYEWSLWLLRIRSQYERRRHHDEFFIELERNTMVLMAKIHGNKHITATDFYTLPYDKPKTETTRKTGIEMWEALPEKLKRLKNRK